MDTTSSIEYPKTGADYEALARHYEDAAKSMQAEADLQKKMLDEYQTHGYYYGRKTGDLIEHTQALIKVYQEAADANRNMAHYHRRLAEDAKQ